MTRRTRAWEIARRNGDRLLSASVPFSWSDRAALAFRTQRDAEAFVSTTWGVAVARERGIRVVAA